MRDLGKLEIVVLKYLPVHRVLVKEFFHRAYWPRLFHFAHDFFKRVALMPGNLCAGDLAIYVLDDIGQGIDLTVIKSLAFLAPGRVSPTMFARIELECIRFPPMQSLAPLMLNAK